LKICGRQIAWRSSDVVLLDLIPQQAFGTQELVGQTVEIPRSLKGLDRLIFRRFTVADHGDYRAHVRHSAVAGRNGPVFYHGEAEVSAGDKQKNDGRCHCQTEYPQVQNDGRPGGPLPGGEDSPDCGRGGLARGQGVPCQVR
jgi:hypothetical protein